MTEDEEKRKRQCMFVTTYRKDFIKRPIEKLKSAFKEQEFRDPLAHAFENFLDIDKKEYTHPVEDGDAFLEKMRKTRKKLCDNYYQNPLDHDIINWTDLLSKKSSYQVDYCDIEGDMKKEEEKKAKISKRLPDGWEFPLTTQLYDFRDPVTLTEFGLDRATLILPVNNIVRDEKLNEIMKLQKLDSEYNSVMGSLGKFIIENEVFGKVNKME